MSLIIHLAIFLLILNVPESLSIKPRFKSYCPLKCGKRENVICHRRKSCAAVQCCKDKKITPKFRAVVLELHNTYREMIASGGPNSLFKLGARNMNALSYDLEMELFAACLAYTCPRGAYDIDPYCTRSDRFKVGINYFWGQNLTDDANETMKVWFDGKRDMIDNDLHYTDREWDERDHFKQMVWAETKYVGCACARYGNNQVVFICAYGPEAFTKGHDVYDITSNPREIGSRCKVRNKRYPSLCGRIWKIPKEASWAKADRNIANFNSLILIAIVAISGWKLKF